MTDATEMTRLVQALTQLVQGLQPSGTVQNRTPDDIVASQNITFEPFDEDVESFKSYRQRLENFFSMKNLLGDAAESAKAKVFINSIGGKWYSKLCALCGQDSPSSKTYSVLVSLLELAVSPKKNILVEQHRFFCSSQGDNEDVAQFVTKLKSLSAECDFICPMNECKQPIADLFLRIQFIRGIRDSSTREALLQEKDLTFARSVEIALATEAAKYGSRIIEQTSSGAEVNKISGRLATQGNSRGNSDCSCHRVPSYKNNPGINRGRGRVNYRELGIQGLCLRCGRNNHIVTDCRVSPQTLKCTSCQKTGHVSRVCLKTLSAGKSSKPSSQDSRGSAVKQITDESSNESDAEVFPVFRVIDVPNEVFKASLESPKGNKYHLTVTVEDRIVQFEIDSGSGASIMSLDSFKALNLSCELRNTDVVFKTYTGEYFKPFGVAQVKVTCGSVSCMLDLYIVKTTAVTIMGRSWMRPLGLQITQVQDVQLVAVPDTPAKIFETFADIFTEKVGTIPGISCNLNLKPGAAPVFVKARPVPYALQEQVSQELELMENQGIITRADKSEWGSPLVIVPKPGNQIRLCVDFKRTVNPLLFSDSYPLPLMDNLFNKMQGGRVFCKLDVYKAYLHVKMSEESAKIQSISTHKGIYKMNRLAFGVKTAPNEFQRIMDNAFGEMEGVAVYFDDIVIMGKTLEQCRVRLFKCLAKLREMDLHLNKKKCKFFVPAVDFLGHRITENGLEKTDDKIRAITDAPQPTSPDEVASFLGLVMYYSKFIKNASTLTAPLRNAQKEGKSFKWTTDCDRAFKRLKQAIASPVVLTPFNPELPVILATDASPHGISGILSHVIDGVERPVYFVSRALTKVEQRYSQLDREATAIFWSVKKFYNYLYGRRFTLVCDNKPLTHIFSPNAMVPVMSASRLVRYASFLSAFDYDIKHQKADLHKHADYLSRAPLHSAEGKLDESSSYQVEVINSIGQASLDHKIIKAETANDKELSSLVERVEKGKECNPEYSLLDGIIFFRDRVYVPETLRALVLSELHSEHFGLVKLKMLARSHVYWPGINRDIELLVKSCKACADNKAMPAKAPVQSWGDAKAPMNRVHIDFAGPIKGLHFLLVIDAFSKWPEVFTFTKPPTSKSTITALTEVFSRYGLPVTLVSDNASTFKSVEFESFCSHYGIEHKTSAEYHPASNGQVERAVRVLKEKLKALSHEPGTVTEKIRRILFKWRIVPSASTGKSPAEHFLGRPMRSRLDILRPPPLHSKTSTSEDQRSLRKLATGDRVQSRNYRGKGSWDYGCIERRLGKYHYIVRLDSGQLQRRHVNQLRSTAVKAPVRLTHQPISNSVRSPESAQNFSSFAASTQSASTPSTTANPSTDQPQLDDPTPPSRESDISSGLLRRSERIRRPHPRYSLYVPL